MTFLTRCATTFEAARLLAAFVREGFFLREPFIERAIRTMSFWSMQGVTQKSRIDCMVLPCWCCGCGLRGFFLQDGTCVFCVIDETGKLKYDHGNGMPEIALRLRLPIEFLGAGDNDLIFRQILGPVFICKCPVLSPGKNIHVLTTRCLYSSLFYR